MKKISTRLLMMVVFNSSCLIVGMDDWTKVTGQIEKKKKSIINLGYDSTLFFHILPRDLLPLIAQFAIMQEGYEKNYEEFHEKNYSALKFRCALQSSNPLILDLVPSLWEHESKMKCYKDAAEFSLYDAVIKKDFKILRSLRDSNSSIFTQAIEGISPFSIGIYYRDLELCNALLDTQTYFNESRQNMLGQALRLACSLGSSSIVKKLLSFNLPLNDCPKNENSPLYYATAYGHPDVMEILIEAGADINSRSIFGDLAPLHAAVGCPQAVQLLLKYGANPMIRDSSGYLPLAYAVYAREDDSVRLLLERYEPILPTWHELLLLCSAKGQESNQIKELLLKAGICVDNRLPPSMAIRSQQILLVSRLHALHDLGVPAQELFQVVIDHKQLNLVLQLAKDFMDEIDFDQVVLPQVCITHEDEMIINFIQKHRGFEKRKSSTDPFCQEGSPPKRERWGADDPQN